MIGGQTLCSNDWLFFMNEKLKTISQKKGSHTDAPSIDNNSKRYQFHRRFTAKFLSTWRVPVIEPGDRADRIRMQCLSVIMMMILKRPLD